MKKILMIAFHYPPFVGSSGVQRTLRFVQHLPALGWQPIVLTASTNAYERMSNNEVSSDIVVKRAFALDTARHLQLGGHYLGWMARPDRWASWKFDAIRQGLKLIKDFKPDVIWSTFPVATAHVIASALQQKTSLPWVADFRDPMAQEGYPSNRKDWLAYKSIEEHTVRQAKNCIFTTTGAAHLYQSRYPQFFKKIQIIENGYDEESFHSINEVSNFKKISTATFVLLHSGTVYSSERDPSEFFKAIRNLNTSGLLTPDDFCIRFRASGNDDFILKKAHEFCIAEFIELAPALSYKEALQEMMAADALLIMQASNCNAQVPAKVYEYIRATRPILALTDPMGDTATLLNKLGINTVARLDSALEISSLLINFINTCKLNKYIYPNKSLVESLSRYNRSKSFVEILNQVLL